MALPFVNSLNVAFLGGLVSWADSELMLFFVMWLSSELSSSPEEAPNVKVAPFLAAARRFDGVYWGDDLRIGAGIAVGRCVCERYDDGKPVLNPRTMLCLFSSMDELSEEGIGFESSDPLLLTAEVDDSGWFVVMIDGVGFAGLCVGAGASAMGVGSERGC